MIDNSARGYDNSALKAMKIIHDIIILRNPTQNSLFDPEDG